MATTYVLLALLGIAVGAMALGAYVAKSLRFPEAGWKVSLVIASIGLSVLVLATGRLKQGIDLKGGAILIYEVDEEQSKQVAARQSTDGKAAEDDPADPSLSQSVDMQGLIQALSRRINPTGVSEIVVRRYGDKQVEIIIPDVQGAEVERIKNRITTGGFLEFLIVANQRDHGDIMRLADDPAQVGLYEVKDAAGTVVGRWVKLAYDTSKKLAEGEEPVYRIDPPMAKSRLVRGRKEVLMVVNPEFALQGSHLTNIHKGYQDISPAVFFNTTIIGARLMGGLTASNLPDKTANHYALLGIVMDNELLNAPRINSTITDSGIIEGYNSDAEVDDLVNILRAGRLPAVLREQPISEDTISPLLGTDTIKQGQSAIVISLVVVLGFMLVYYRYAGLISCIALLLNLLFTIALMIFIGAAMSLPGMAGMVLTVGMSVDANVLVFERIREELRNGAAIRMAIRNGFARATTTIIDSNLTTLATALVLYWVGNEQLKSFAVTLTLGILMCIYTAVFISRLMFELTDRFSRIKKLTMMEAIKVLNVDYYGMLVPALVLSGIFIGVGLAAVIARGERIFDIDFTGGYSVRVLLKDPMPIADARKFAEKLKSDGITEDVSVTEVVSEKLGAGRIYRIDASIPEAAEAANVAQQTGEGILKVKDALVKHFRDANGNLLLQTQSLQFTPPTAPTSAPAKPAANSSSQVRPGREFEALSGWLQLAQADAPVASDTPAAVDGNTTPTTSNDASTLTVPESSEPASDAAPNAPSSAAPASADGAADVAEPSGTATDGATVGPVSPVAEVDAASSADLATEATLPATESTDVSRLQSETKLEFGSAINADTIEALIRDAAKALGLGTPDIALSNPDWKGGSGESFASWTVQLSSSTAESQRILEKLQADLNGAPVWMSANQIGSSVAGDKTRMAFIAVFLSFLVLILYIWFRFERLTYGVAAIIALIHDVLVTLGAIAMSYWLKDYLGFLMIEEFKISLPVLAAILTIIGYSLNDTIVIFDRIREVKGKSPVLTAGMINKSVNQTMSRTILTAVTVFLSVVVLYISGGQGVHAFAFAMLIGVIAGSYSTIYIAAPILLWFQPQPEATTTSTTRSTGKAIAAE